MARVIRDYSELHHLVVNEVPEDGIDVEHPSGCGGLHPDGVHYDCWIDALVADEGMGAFFAHRDDTGEDITPDVSRLAPGRYPVKAWCEQIEDFNGVEYYSGLALVAETTTP